MFSFTKYKGKRRRSLSFILLFIAAFDHGYTQKRNDLTHDKTYKDSLAIHLKTILKQNILSLQINGSVLPRGNIKTIEGNYHLRSKLQSSFAVGADYQFNLSNFWSCISGIHINLTKTNFFLHIPDSDLPAFLSTNGAPQIEEKEVNFRLMIPFKMVRRMYIKKNGFWDVKAGFILNYSGFNSDALITTSLADTNYMQQNIFYGNFKGDNNKKPWLNLIVSTSKNYLLKNNNLIAFELFVELSNIDFLKGDYEITIPDKPTTKGRYSVNGSGVGLSMRYSFTGANKRLVRRFQKAMSY